MKTLYIIIGLFFFSMSITSYAQISVFDIVEDAKKESWRLHVPIRTNPGCFFEWKLASGKIERVHFPADGRGYFVRVDQTHRAVNQMPEGAKRVHLLCGVRGRPAANLFADAYRL